MIPDDVQRLARPVLAHRLLPTAEAIVERHLPEQVVDRIVAQAATTPAMSHASGSLAR